MDEFKPTDCVFNTAPFISMYVTEDRPSHTNHYVLPVSESYQIELSDLEKFKIYAYEYMHTYTNAGFLWYSTLNPIHSVYIHGCSDAVTSAWLSVLSDFGNELKIKCKAAIESDEKSSNDVHNCKRQREQDNIARDQRDVSNNSACAHTNKIAFGKRRHETSYAEIVCINKFKDSIRDTLRKTRESGEKFNDLYTRDDCKQSAYLCKTYMDVKRDDDIEACSYFPAVKSAIDRLRLCMRTCRALDTTDASTRDAAEECQNTKIYNIMEKRDADCKAHRQWQSEDGLWRSVD